MSANDRAGVAAEVIIGRHVRRLPWLPGSRLAAVHWPSRRIVDQFGSWHYWWHAHLVDVLVDAAIHRPAPGLRNEVNRLLRGIRLRNLGRWTNDYYDDMAWLGLAIERTDRHLGLRHDRAADALTDQLLGAWVPQLGGGIPWRKADLFFNAPANGPAAILLARTGHVERAAAMADWLDTTLIDTGSDLVIDGVTPGVRGGPMARTTAIYTYCQGVVLGAELELLRRTGDVVHAERIDRLLTAVETHLCPDRVIPAAGGGDGGLFMGILARYLALVATDLPRHVDGSDDLRARATRIVTSSADAAWASRVQTPAGPVFSADWHRPAVAPDDDGRKGQLVAGAVHASMTPERDLSVQLSAWMALEAAAGVSLGLREHVQNEPA